MNETVRGWLDKAEADARTARREFGKLADPRADLNSLKGEGEKRK